jgi:pyruvate kinase
MEYEVIATLGPNSDGESTWQAMCDVGVTGFRLNTSHLSLSQLESWVGRLGAFLATQDTAPSLVLDLQGSKWRLGQFPEWVLTNGQRVTLVCAASTDDPGTLPVPHPDFFRAASMSSGEIVLDDAKLRLVLEAQGPDALQARVIDGGVFLPRKGITYAASTYRQESLSENDRAVLDSTRQLAGVRYAVSYVKDAVEMAHFRAQIGSSAHLIAKLERRPALEEAPGIAESADELWLCRGDLGAELGARAMAEAAHQFSAKVRAMPVPVLLAGQVYEHMTEHAAPTRAELCGAYDALGMGYRGFVLSDETAIGRDPVASCRVAALFRG